MDTQKTTQREIKFRAWDKKNKKMMIVFGVWSYGGLHNIHGCEIDYIPMQYTGLKDKNGKEIYEGDLLDGIFKGGWIVWCEKCAGFQYRIECEECMACSGDVHWHELRDNKGIEVIGNIYENLNF